MLVMLYIAMMFGMALRITSVCARLLPGPEPTPPSGAQKRVRYISRKRAFCAPDRQSCSNWRVRFRVAEQKA